MVGLSHGYFYFIINGIDLLQFYLNRVKIHYMIFKK